MWLSIRRFWERCQFSVATAPRLTVCEALAAEAAALEADEADRREMREVAAMMEGLRAPW